MSSVFSTVINFSLLGLLRRLHRIYIQNVLEAEGTANDIIFPRKEKHHKKHGATDGAWVKSHDVSHISLDDINIYWINTAKDKVQELLEELGMDALLKANNHRTGVSAGINAVEIIRVSAGINAVEIK